MYYVFNTHAHSDESAALAPPNSHKSLTYPSPQFDNERNTSISKNTVCYPLLTYITKSMFLVVFTRIS